VPLNNPAAHRVKVNLNASLDPQTAKRGSLTKTHVLIVLVLLTYRSLAEYYRSGHPARRTFERRRNDKDNKYVVFLLGLWFGIFPRPIGDFTGSLHKEPIQQTLQSLCVNQAAVLEKCQSWCTKWEQKHPAESPGTVQTQTQGTLAPTHAGLGGVCSMVDGGLESILLEYFRNCFPDDMARVKQSHRGIAELSRGRLSWHRSFALKSRPKQTNTTPDFAAVLDYDVYLMSMLQY